MVEIYQVIAKLLDGKSKTLNFTTPSIPIISIKSRIFELTSIPIHDQILLSNGKTLHDDGTLVSSPVHFLHLLVRLRAGKGGFGSLLRGAATKAGQKKTNNFDACRDMSGRRLRHVNAEKKMEEWAAEEKERKLEKVAEEFIKKREKMAKKSGGGGGGDGGAEKYVEKYRKDSAKCMEEVEKSVRESIGDVLKSKRKVVLGDVNGSESKKLKIWMGKRKFNESDSDSDDEMAEDNEKSAVTNNENQSDSNKEDDGSSGSVNGGKLEGESSVRCSFESCSEEEKESVPEERLGSFSDASGGCLTGEGGDHDPSEPVLEIREECMVQNKVLDVAVVSGNEGVQVKKESNKTEFGHVEETGYELPGISSVQEAGASDVEGTEIFDLKPVLDEETLAANNNGPDLEKPLNFDDFSSAAEFEILGMDRLKSELQERSLKCGGTLQERAARLFLLKTTPLEKLPKKLLAKK